MSNEDLSKEQLTAIMYEILLKLTEIEKSISLRQKLINSTEKNQYIYGLKGLAKFLNISHPTAQKIKNSGKIPFSQCDRMIIFNKSDVLESLNPKKSL